MAKCIEERVPEIFHEQRRVFGTSDSLGPGVGYRSIGVDTLALYSKNDDMIYVDTSKAHIDDCDDIASHETTHAHEVRMLDELGIDWDNMFDSYSFTNAENYHSKKLVTEGVAECMADDHSEPFIAGWPTEEIGPIFNYYEHGHKLVHPLMKTYGPPVVWYMMRSPPVGEELLFPESWRIRIREEATRDPLGVMGLVEGKT